MNKLRRIFTDPQQARRLAQHLWRHFREDRCFDEAAALSFTSLLSLVPLLAVVLGFAAAFEVFEQWSLKLQQFILANLVTATGLQLQVYLEQFIGGVNRLTITGIIFLIITALLLMMRIETSFNRIWRVPVERHLINKITMYWAVLTLGPLALGFAAALSAQPLFDLVGLEEGGIRTLRSVGIFALTWLAFGLIFLLVPNCRVPVSYAASGALLSAILFSLAKGGFLIYVERASYNVIYGALAGIPIFLLWLYLVWVVILLGASLAAAMTTFRDRRGEWRWPQSWELLLVLRFLSHLYRAQARGRSLSVEELLDLEPGVASARLQAILASLVRENLVTQDENGWLLKRDLSRYSLLELYQAGDYHLPIGKKVPVPSSNPLDPIFLEIINGERVNLERSLTEIFDEAEDPA